MREQVERERLASVQAALLDDILFDRQLKNDAALSRLVEMSPPVISKLRHGHLPMGPGVLIALNEATGRSIQEMKRRLGQRVIGDPRPEPQEAPTEA